jgi:hypothetical protein
MQDTRNNSCNTLKSQAGSCSRDFLMTYWYRGERGVAAAREFILARRSFWEAFMRGCRKHAIAASARTEWSQNLFAASGDLAVLRDFGTEGRSRARNSATADLVTAWIMFDPPRQVPLPLQYCVVIS